MKDWRKGPAEIFCFRRCVTLRGHHQDTVGTAGCLPVCLGHNRTIGTLPARPGHGRHGGNTARTPSSCLGHDRDGKIVVQPGCRAGSDADGSAGSPSG